MTLFINYLFTDPHFFFSVALIVVFSICCHEFMHAWVALKQGDSTAADAGHLTLNPLRQMGLTSLIMFLIIGIAWGQVPVRPARMRHSWSDALVSFAGPATNLALYLIFGSLCFILFKHNIGNEFTWSILQYGSELNIVLFILNMLPVPGFDGWHIFAHFFPRLNAQHSEVIKGAFFVAILLVFLFIEYLFAAASFMTALLLRSLQAIFG